MEYTKSLIKSCVDLDINDYIIVINNICPQPLNENVLMDFLEILSSNKIHHFLLIKYNIISVDTNIPMFLALYSNDFIQEGHDYYFTYKDFEHILTYESRTLYDYYLIVSKYKRWYRVYQNKLHEVLELRSRYIRLSSMVSEIHSQYSKINSLRDGTVTLDNMLEEQIKNLVNLECEIKKTKKEIYDKLNKILR